MIENQEESVSIILSEQQSPSEQERWVTKLQFHKWLRISCVITLSLACLVISDNTGHTLLLAGVPYFLLDLINIVCYLSLIRSRTKVEAIKDLVDTIASMIFKALQVLHWELGQSYFSVTIVPLLVSQIVRIVLPTKELNQCHSFSNTISFFGNWGKLITLTMVGLKLDFFSEWTWEATIWPIWIGFGFVFLLSAGIFVRLILTVAGYVSGETLKEELLALFWLFILGVGVSASFTHFFYALLQGSSVTVAATLPLSFMALFTFGIIMFFKNLTELCETVMANATIDNTSSKKVFETTMKNPEFMFKVSSNFFQKFEADQHTLDLKELDNTRIGKESNGLCEICCQNKNNAVIMNCLHGGACVKCTIKIWDLHEACFLCREPISEVLEVVEEDANLFRVVSTTRILNKDRFT